MSENRNYSPHRLIWFLLVAGIVLIDQITKVIAQKNLQGHDRIEYLGGFFVFQYAENPGAFLSLGADLPDEIRFIIFVVAVALFLIGIAYMVFVKTQPPLAAAVFSLLLGGGISNLIDRAFRENGQVIDFMNMGIGGLRTGIFNVADFAIVLAIGLGIVEFFVGAKQDREHSESGG